MMNPIYYDKFKDTVYFPYYLDEIKENIRNSIDENSLDDKYDKLVQMEILDKIKLLFNHEICTATQCIELFDRYRNFNCFGDYHSFNLYLNTLIVEHKKGLSSKR